MKMKNVLMILIALAMVFTMVGVVSATTSINPDEQILDGWKDDSGTYINNAGNAYVNYTVYDAFEVIVPASVDFNTDTLFKVHTINVTKSLIGYDKYLHVNFSSDNFDDGEFRLVAQTISNWKSYIPYNITYEGGNQITTNPCTVLTVEAGQPHPSMGVAKAGYGIGDFVELNFTTTQDYIEMATMSGLHQDTLKFMFWVDDTEESN